jgi:hypothetical protein
VNTLFFRLLSHEDKATALSEAVAAVGEGHSLNPMAHAVDPASFRQVPGSPFAYWVSERIRRLFTELAPFEGEGRTVKAGLCTGDDFRFVRTWWEVPPERILEWANGPDWRKDLPAFQAWCRQRTFAGKRWVPFAKGGEYSPYYADLHLGVNWERDGEEMKAWADPLYGNSGWSRIIKSVDFYFRPGLTWSRRTQLGLNLRAYPAGAIFADKGPVAFLHQEVLPQYLGLSNSNGFGVLISLQMAFGAYEVGVIQRTSVPDLTGFDGKHLGELAQSALGLKQSLDAANETSHVFVQPALLQVSGGTLIQRAEACRRQIADVECRLVKLQESIDQVARRLYGLAGEDQQAIQVSLDRADTPQDTEEEATSLEHEGISAADSRTLLINLLSYVIGTALGRWDIRYATGQRFCPELPNPFAPLPVCSQGMRIGEDGLPLREALQDYPLRIDWDGILVDDHDHPDDIIRRVWEVLEVLWHDRSEAIEQEACEILGIKELRDYFRKPGKGGFWDDHVKRYSKSRRKAPIYWLLQSSKKNYALWLYYHRLDKDMLFKALVNYVEPKIRLEEGRLDPLQAQRTAAGASGKGVKKLEKEIAQQEEFISELRDFEDKLRRVANLHLDPDLNDGVVLNIAPLRELVSWKEAQKYWDELLDGKYEWSSIGRQLRQLSLVRSP